LVSDGAINAVLSGMKIGANEDAIQASKSSSSS